MWRQRALNWSRTNFVAAHVLRIFMAKVQSHLTVGHGGAQDVALQLQAGAASEAGLVDAMDKDDAGRRVHGAPVHPTKHQFDLHYIKTQ